MMQFMWYRSVKRKREKRKKTRSKPRRTHFRTQTFRLQRCIAHRVPISPHIAFFACCKIIIIGCSVHHIPVLCHRIFSQKNQFGTKEFAFSFKCVRAIEACLRILPLKFPSYSKWINNNKGIIRNTFHLFAFASSEKHPYNRTPNNSTKKERKKKKKICARHKSVHSIFSGIDTVNLDYYLVTGTTSTSYIRQLSSILGTLAVEKHRRRIFIASGWQSE